MIRKQLTDRARDFNIILDDVSITELSFGKDYSAAVEAKQIAQQEAQRAVYMVEKAKQEKQQKIVQAEVGSDILKHHAVDTFLCDRERQQQQPCWALPSVRTLAISS